MRFGKFIILITFLATSVSQVQAQEYNIGIRAGLNFGEYLGPQIPDVEKFSVSSGFHFGINFSYNLSDFLAVRGELLYNQNGTKYSFDGDGWYRFNTGVIETGSEVSNGFPQYYAINEIVRDKSKINLDISSGGVALPISFHLKTLEKWEVFAGGYVNFIFSSIGTGEWKFGPEFKIGEESVEHAFIQGQFHNYRNDEPRDANNRTFTAPITLRANGTKAEVRSPVGAYYLENDQDYNGNRIRSMDYGVLAGVSYYLNRGLYISLRGDLGMRDMTNNNAEYSYAEINDDGSFVYSDDFDRNFTIGLSLGFKF